MLLEPDERTLKDCFDRSHAPVATVASGSIVTFRLLDAGWNVEPMRAPGVPGRRWQDRSSFAGHALAGPVAVEGARAGDALEVEVVRLRPAPWGWTRSGGDDTELQRRFGVASEKHWQLWTIDRQAGFATDQSGRRVRLSPFLGVMGNAPAAPGRHSTTPPRRVGGNLDLKELTEGASLFLPVEVDGGLFYCGDGHAAQGDGEVGGTAIECPMEEAVLRFTVHPGRRLLTPLARTPDAWIAAGTGDTLDEAAAVALNGILDLMQERLGVGRSEALALASAAVDLRVTQMVNQRPGVHATWRDASLE